MKRYIVVLIVAVIYGCSLRALSPSREASDHSTSEGPVLHDESRTTITPDMQTLAWEIQEVRNTVVSQNQNVTNEVKPWLWFMMGWQLIQSIQLALARRRKA